MIGQKAHLDNFDAWKLTPYFLIFSFTENFQGPTPAPHGDAPDHDKPKLNYSTFEG